MLERQSGAVIWERLRLERVLPDRVENRLWLATDLLSGSSHALEFLPADCPQYENLVHPWHRGLLAFYRCEGSAPDVAAVSAYHPALEAPALDHGEAVKAITVSAAFDCLSGLGESVSRLHEAGLPAHGAIGPSRVRLIPEGGALLTGYPYAAGASEAVDPAYLSPQRLAGNSPDVSDDVYGLAALAYFLISGGEAPSRSEGAAKSQRFALDELRRQHGLPPTGWPARWERPIEAALSSTASLRPTSVRAFVEALRESTGLPLPEVRSEPDRWPQGTRQLPSWRIAKSQRSNRESSDGEATSKSGGLLQTLVEVRAEKVALQRLEQDLNHRKEAMLSDMQEAAVARADAERLEKQIKAERAALDQVRAEFDAGMVALAHDRAVLERESRALAEERKTFQSEAREQARDEAQDLVKERAKIEEQERALQTQRQSLESGVAQVTDSAQRLEIKARDLDQRMAALAESERVLTALSGSAEPSDWKRFTESFLTSSSTTRGGVGRVPKPEDLGERALMSDAKLGPTPPSETAPILADRLPAVTTPLGEPRASLRRATLALPTGRRLHLFSGSVLRFGRHGESDFLLVAMLRGQSSNLGLVREISRKHFELHVSASGVRLMDGWSGEAKPSQHGVCIDGRQVTADGAEVRNGSIISVTTRAPSRTVPHWKIQFLPVARRLDTAPSFPTTAPASPSLAAVLMQRLDDAPDDLLIALDAVHLRDAGVVAPDLMNLEFVPTAEGFAYVDGSRKILLVDGMSPHPSVSVVSAGRLSPFASTPSAV